MPRANISLVTLYTLLQEVKARLDSHDRRFKSIDDRFKSIDDRFKSIDGRFDSMVSLQKKMAVRLVSIEERQKSHTRILVSLRVRVATLHRQIEKLAGHYTRLEQEYAMITAGLRRIETRFDRLEAQRLAERIEALEARVSNLESPRP